MARRTFALPVFAAAALLAGSSPAQENPARAKALRDAQKPLQYDVSVTRKLIQVYVTDSKGRPVTDLAGEDFVVLEDGRPVTVTDFERHAMTVPGAAAEPAAPAPAPALAPTPPSLARKFFLVFDFTFNNLRGARKAKEAAVEFVGAALKPGDQAALVTYSMVKGLRLHEGLTADLEMVRRAIAGTDERSASGRMADLEDAYALLQREGGALQTEINAGALEHGATAIFPGGGSGPAFRVESGRQEVKRVAHRYMDRMIDLARSLRTVPGRKNVVLFSSGIPQSLLYGMPVVDGTSRVTDGVGDHVLIERMEEMVREFAAADCSIYSFDTREAPVVPSLFDYDEQTFEGRSRDLGKTQSIFRDDRTTGLGTLRKLSNETGGGFYGNVNVAAANLRKVARETEAFYVLGFPAREGREGAFHSVEVSVRRKGCRVRSQKGYFEPKPFRDYGDLERRIHLFELLLNETSGDRPPRRLGLTALAFDAGGRSRVEIVARLPKDFVEAVPGRRVESVAVVLDETEKVVEMTRSETDLSRHAGREIFYATGAPLPPGSYLCRLAVRDLDTGDSAVGSARASIAPDRPGLNLRTPFVLTAAIPSAFLGGSPAGTTAAPAWPEPYEFDRSTLSPAPGELPSAAGPMTVIVPYTVDTGEFPDSVATISFLDAATGATTPVTVEDTAWSRSGSADRLVFKCARPAMKPGKYYLFVRVQPSGAAAAISARTVVTLN